MENVTEVAKESVTVIDNYQGVVDGVKLAR